MPDLGKFFPEKTTPIKLWVDRLPSSCPGCHVRQEPRETHLNRLNAAGTVISVFFCTNDECLNPFFAIYETSQGARSDQCNGKLLAEYPHSPEPLEHSSFIKELSEEFVITFDQAQEALDRNLDRVAGCGFRRALEFLVKDYLIGKDKSKEAYYLDQFLGNCIKEIPDRRVQELAVSTNLIGTDEGHYVRRWKDGDVEKLRKYVLFVEHFIAVDLESAKLAQDASDEKQRQKDEEKKAKTSPGKS